MDLINDVTQDPWSFCLQTEAGRDISLQGGSDTTVTVNDRSFCLLVDKQKQLGTCQLVVMLLNDRCFAADCIFTDEPIFINLFKAVVYPQQFLFYPPER